MNHAILRQRDPRKVGSDAFDVVRLLQRHGPTMLGDELLEFAPSELIEGVERVAVRHLLDEANRTAAAMIRSSIPGVQAIGVEQIEVLGRALVDHLQGRSTGS